MATGNFHSENCENIYVIDYGDDQFMWDECQEHIGEGIKYHLQDFHLNKNIRSKYELGSYPSSSIGSIDESLYFLNLDIVLTINVFIRSGYYQAANLDWELAYTVDGVDFEDIDEIMDMYPGDFDINQGLWAIHKDNLQDKLGSLQADFTESIEEVLAKISEPYCVSASFSNGETWYEKIGA